MSDFTAQMKHYRELREMSLTDLAKATGITRGFLHRIETGQSEPTIYKVIAIAAALGVRVADLVGEDVNTPLTVNECRVLEAYRNGDAAEYMRLFATNEHLGF